MDVYRLMEAYRDMLEESAAGPKPHIDAYDEADGHWNRHVLPETILPKVVWELLWEEAGMPLMTPERVERREQLIYRRPFDFEHDSGSQLSYFSSVTAGTVRQLLAEGFLFPDRRSKYAPSVLKVAHGGCVYERCAKK